MDAFFVFEKKLKNLSVTMKLQKGNIRVVWPNNQANYLRQRSEVRRERKVSVQNLRGIAKFSESKSDFYLELML